MLSHTMTTYEIWTGTACACYVWSTCELLKYVCFGNITPIACELWRTQVYVTFWFRFSDNLQCCCTNITATIVPGGQISTWKDHNRSIDPYMNFMKIVFPLHCISWKKTPDDAVTPQRQSQFTPKTKANAVPRLLSSLVWIDQYNEWNGMTNFMEFMINIK